VEMEVLKARIQAYRESAAQTVPISEAMIENKVDLQPEVVRLKANIADLQVQLQSHEPYSTKGDKDPAIQQLSQQIQQSEKSLAQLRTDLRKQVRTELQLAAAAKRDEQIAALENELQSRRIAAEMLRARYESQMREGEQTNGDTMQLRFKQGELERAEKVYDLISQRIVELSTETGAPQRITVIQRALVPTAPIEALPYCGLLLAPLIGFCLPFVALLLFSAVSWILSACFPAVKFPAEK
jgi:hypothetical protein